MFEEKQTQNNLFKPKCLIMVLLKSVEKYKQNKTL